MELPERRRLTLDQYLALEAVSTERLEFRDGYAVALAVPTKNHARIAGNLVMSLGPLVRAQYRSIPELTHYVVIDSRRRWMRLDERTADGSLALRGPLAQLVVPKLAKRGLAIDEIYRDTTVPRTDAPQRSSELLRDS